MANSFYGILHEVGSSGIVEHAVSCRFVTSEENVLIVGRPRVLEVYRITSSSDENNSFQTGSTIAGHGLELLCRYPLFGTLQSISVIKCNRQNKQMGDRQVDKIESENHKTYGFSHSETDLLLLTFDRGKASIVGYDPELGPHVLRTFELFNFEDGALGSEITASQFALSPYGFGCMSFGLVDPGMRCAAIMVYGQYIGIIPLRNQEDPFAEGYISVSKKQKLDEEGKEEESEDFGIQQYEMRKDCCLLNLEANGIYGCGAVRHIAFSSNSGGQPILAILHSSPQRASTGRLSAAKFTCELTALVIDCNGTGSNTSRVLWQVQNLPHDCDTVVSTSQGSFVVLSQNAILHVNGSPSEIEALYVNSFANSTIDNRVFKRRTTAREDFRLDSARYAWLDSNRLLFSLRYGQIGLLDLNTMDFKFYGISVQASCICVIDKRNEDYGKGSYAEKNGFVFLGSHIADSVLMKYSLFDNRLETGNEGLNMFDTLRNRESKSVETWEKSLKVSKEVAEAVEKEESYLYGNSSNSSKRGRQTEESRVDLMTTFDLQLSTCDALVCTGPMASFAHGEIVPIKGVAMKRAEQIAEILNKEGKFSAAARVLNEARGREKIASSRRRRLFQIVSSFGRGEDGGICVFEPEGVRLNENYSMDILFSPPPALQSLSVSERISKTVEWKDVSLWWPLPELMVACIRNAGTFLIEDGKVIVSSVGSFDPGENTLHVSQMSKNVMVQVCSENFHEFIEFSI